MAAATNELRDSEKLLFDAIQKGETSEVVRLLNGECRADCLDANGMTPLQHAAYRGQKELCEILLNAGADVNSSKHVHGYSALMFASLAGSESVTALLLAAGASTTAINSVGRNAAQMAAFVGNRLCVSVINNFVPEAMVEYYAKLQGLETEPKLARHLVTPLHRLVLRPNVHPVAVALFLADHPALFMADVQASRVLRLMCEREVKRADANEVLALKYHSLAFFVTECRRLYEGGQRKKDDATDLSKSGQRQNAKGETNPVATVLDDVIRHWLKTRESDGLQENMEKLVRAGIRDFPYPQCTIVQQLVRSLSSARVGEEPPTALSLLTASVAGSGPRSEDDGQCEACGTAGRAAALKRCSVCRSVHYCDRRCQRLHWPVHRKLCPRLAEEQRRVELFRQKEEEEKASGKESDESSPPVGQLPDMPLEGASMGDVVVTVSDAEPASSLAPNDTAPEE